MTVIRPEGDPNSRGERDDSEDYIIVDDLTTQADEEFNARMEREQAEREDLARRMHEWSTRTTQPEVVYNAEDVRITNERWMWQRQADSYLYLMRRENSARGSLFLNGPFAIEVLEMILGDLPWSTLDVRTEPRTYTMLNYHTQADAAARQMSVYPPTEEGTEMELGWGPEGIRPEAEYQPTDEARRLDNYRPPNAGDFPRYIEDIGPEPDDSAFMGLSDLDYCWRCDARGDIVRVDREDDLGLCGRCKRELKELSE